jgi:hypothetical protein
MILHDLDDTIKDLRQSTRPDRDEVIRKLEPQRNLLIRMLRTAEEDGAVAWCRVSPKAAKAIGSIEDMGVDLQLPADAHAAAHVLPDDSAIVFEFVSQSSGIWFRMVVPNNDDPCRLSLAAEPQDWT